MAQEKFFERLREDRLKELHATRDKLKAIRPKCVSFPKLSLSLMVKLSFASHDLSFHSYDTLIASLPTIPSKTPPFFL